MYSERLSLFYILSNISHLNLILRSLPRIMLVRNPGVYYSLILNKYYLQTAHCEFFHHINSKYRDYCGHFSPS